MKTGMVTAQLALFAVALGCAGKIASSSGSGGTGAAGDTVGAAAKTGGTAGDTGGTLTETGGRAAGTGGTWSAPDAPKVVPIVPVVQANGNEGLWSDPKTWPLGRVPVSNEDVTIPSGLTVRVDVSPPPLGAVSVDGALVFQDKPLTFQAEEINVKGLLQLGTQADPLTQPVTVTLTGTARAIDGPHTRGIMVSDGGLHIHGTPPKPTWTKLAASSPVDATELSMLESVSLWKAGDKIVVAPTDFQRIGRTEVLSIASATDKRLTLKTPMKQSRWGVLQYIDESGVTLTPTGAVTDKIIDERAEVGNISRNIVIQGVDDALWKDEGFGAHIMIMRPAQAYLDGVQILRGGQAGLLARYPVHWHRWSYADAGALGDATGQYIKNSAIVSSSQRCITVHATNGLTVENNICYDIHGHAIFLEDAVERRTVIDHNLVLGVELPLEGKALLEHDKFKFGTGPTGLWLTNPDNVIRNNVVADSVGAGYWLAYPTRSLGPSRNAGLEPHNMAFGQFDDNTAHSNGVVGLFMDNPPVDDDGNVLGNRYEPRDEAGKLTTFTLNRFVAYKHERATEAATMWNRMNGGVLTDFVVADHTGVGFAGASLNCVVTRSLVVGRTLNSANSSNSDMEPMGAASYHSACEISDNLFVNLPGVSDKSSGAFGTDDYYLVGLDKGLIQNSGSRFINSHPGYRETSRNTLPLGVLPRRNTRGRENYAFAGALWDPYGYWGPEGNYWVYDLPFFTDGTSCVDTKTSVHSNDKSCEGPYYGVAGHFRLDGESTSAEEGGYRFRPFHVTRSDNNTEWFIDDGDCTPFLGNMRHFAAVKNGTFVVSFPDGQNAIEWDGKKCASEELAQAPPAPSSVSFSVTNVLKADDGFTLAIPYRADVAPTGYVTSFPSVSEVSSWSSYRSWQEGRSDWQTGFRGDMWKPLAAVASLEALKSSTGATFWQDKANQRLYLRVGRAGMSHSSDELYGPLGYVLKPQ